MRAQVAIVLTAMVLAACGQTVRAPDERNVCFHVVAPEGEGEVRFNVLAEDQESIEQCAARLEEMRLRFLRLGGNNREVTGAYNGQFLFIDRAGVWISQKLDGGRFFALARTGDGRLAIPGVIPQEPESPPGSEP